MSSSGFPGLVLALELRRFRVWSAGPEPSDNNRDCGEDEEGWRQHRAQLAIEEREKGDQAEVHHAGGDQDAAGEQVWALFAGGAARHRYRGYGGRIGSAKEGGEDDSAAFFGDFLQDVAAIGDRADGDDDQPGFERVDVEASKFLIGQSGKNDRREEQELGEGENLLRGGTVGESFESGLKFEEQQAGNAEGGGNREVVVVDERADEVGRKARHFRGDASGLERAKACASKTAAGMRRQPGSRE